MKIWNRILYFSVVILSHFFLWIAVLVWALDKHVLSDPGGHGAGALMYLIIAAVGGLVNGIVVSLAVRNTRPRYLFWINLLFLAASLSCLAVLYRH